MPRARPTATKARACDGKQRHDTRTDALGQMFSLARLGSSLAGLNVYRCEHCRCWHVGHRPGNTRRRR